MEYIKVKWIHNFDNEYVLVYAELDSFRNEVRKVEVFRDGSLGFASEDSHSERTRLAETTIPSYDEISADPESEILPTSQSEFEDVWRRAIESQKHC